MGNSLCDWILSLVRPLKRGREPYANLVYLALENQKCEVMVLEPSAKLSPLYDALVIAVRQPELGTRRDARSGSDNASSSSSSSSSSNNS